MKVFLTIVGLLLVAGVAFAMGEVSPDKSYSWRYKMTVEIETPEGVKSGSAVREVTVLFRPTGNKPPNRKYNSDISLKGEAVVVDLGERGMLFATINSSSASSLPFSVFEGPAGLTIEGAEHYSKLKNVHAKLTPTNYPPLVTFTDLNDPLSVKLLLEKETNGKHPIKYTVKTEHFEKYFGEGVRLKGISVEMTDEPMTMSVLNALTWIPRFYDRGRLDGNRYGDADAKNRLANKLSSGSFTTIREY